MIIHNMKEIIYRGNWVLINAYFYSFWMPIEIFKKYNINKNHISIYIYNGKQYFKSDRLE